MAEKKDDIEMEKDLWSKPGTFMKQMENLRARIGIGLIPRSSGMFNVVIDRELLEDTHYMQYLEKAKDILCRFYDSEKKRLGIK